MLAVVYWQPSELPGHLPSFPITSDFIAMPFSLRLLPFPLRHVVACSLKALAGFSPLGAARAALPSLSTPAGVVGGRGWEEIRAVITSFCVRGDTAKTKPQRKPEVLGLGCRPRCFERRWAAPERLNLEVSHSEHTTHMRTPPSALVLQAQNRPDELLQNQPQTTAVSQNQNHLFFFPPPPLAANFCTSQ